MAVTLCITLLALPFLSAADPGHSRNGHSNDLALQLVNGPHRCAGRVEILFNGQWGTVCDDLWDMSDAEVVCRQAGCGKPVSFHTMAHFGQGKGQIVIDDINCRGDELYLWNCSHRGLGVNNCGHSEDAGVTCSGTTIATMVTTAPTKTTTTTTPATTTTTATPATTTTTTTPTTTTTTPATTTTSATTTTTTPTTTTTTPTTTTTTTPTTTTTTPTTTTTTTPTTITTTPTTTTTTPTTTTTTPTTTTTTPTTTTTTTPTTIATTPTTTTTTPTTTTTTSATTTTTTPTTATTTPTTTTTTTPTTTTTTPTTTTTTTPATTTTTPTTTTTTPTTTTTTPATTTTQTTTTTPATTTSTTSQPPVASEKCGEILTDPEGEIRSPMKMASHSENCIWHISVTNNDLVHLHFDSFLMRSSLSCHSFSLSVYDGTPFGSPLLGDLCKTTDQDFISSSNSMSLVYSRLVRDGATGLNFSATYSSVSATNHNVTLHCYSDYMITRVSPAYILSLGHSPENLHLSDPQCRPRVSPDWLEFHIPYQGCQTIKQAQNVTISYSNTLFTHSSELTVTHRKKLSLTLQCRMYQDTMVEALYYADDIEESRVTQYGLYSANLTFFQSSSFINRVSQYPYYVTLGQHLYLQATLNTSDPNLVLFVDTCVASPDPVDSSEKVYYIISNGCQWVPDYRVYSSSSGSVARFGFGSFGFLKLYSSVYIQCKIIVCKKYDERSRCKQGCLTRAKRSVACHGEPVHAVAGPVGLHA